MRSSVLLLVAVMGCGSNGLGADDMATGDQDMAMNGSNDMNVNGDGGANCDVMAQTGCMTGQKCIPAQGGTMMNPTIVGKCVTDGTVPEGMSCMRGMMGAPDNCAAGLICTGRGLPMGMSACRKFCAADSSCTTAGQKCAYIGPTLGDCIPSCTPFGTGCPGGMDCGSLQIGAGSSNTVLNGFYACKTTGAGAAYADCQRSSDCGANLSCDPQANWCAPVCDNTHACAQPPAGDGGVMPVTCSAFDNQTATGLGLCQ